MKLALKKNEALIEVARVAICRLPRVCIAATANVVELLTIPLDTISELSSFAYLHTGPPFHSSRFQRDKYASLLDAVFAFEDDMDRVLFRFRRATVAGCSFPSVHLCRFINVRTRVTKVLHSAAFLIVFPEQRMDWNGFTNTHSRVDSVAQVLLLGT